MSSEQPRERAVPCAVCHRPTFATDAICDDDRCQEREATYRAKVAEKYAAAARPLP